jgi:hypothetical protein
MANTPPDGTQFAIPNFNNTSNTLLVNGEPGTWQCIATGQDFPYMNGTYTTTGSHFFSGGVSPFGTYNCFGRNGIPPLGGDNFYYGPCWESRSGSNNYAANGVYQGSTTTTVNGSPVSGEYVSITSPYGFVLKAYSLISANYNGVSTPASGWVIAGSNDGGTTYTTVDVITNHPLPLGGYEIFNVSNTTSYTTYIIIITTITSGTGAANLGTWNLYSPDLNPKPPCFKKDTQILCYKYGQEQYLPVQDLRNGDLVKTVDNGYVKVHMIGKSFIYNNGDSTTRIKERLYKYTSEIYPEITEDLVLTGCHAILVNYLSEKEMEDTKEFFQKIYVTDNHYRLMTVLNHKAQPYEMEGTFEIWHFALENENYYHNYGVYANGLLVETCSKRYLKELSDMEIIE